MWESSTVFIVANIYDMKWKGAIGCEIKTNLKPDADACAGDRTADPGDPGGGKADAVAVFRNGEGGAVGGLDGVHQG